MTASDDGCPFVASEASNASTLSMTTESGTGRQDSGRVWDKLLRAFDSNRTSAERNAGEYRPCGSAAPQQRPGVGNISDPVMVMLNVPYILP
jgi:hypothetical protein